MVEDMYDVIALKPNFRLLSSNKTMRYSLHRFIYQIYNYDEIRLNMTNHRLLIVISLSFFSNVLNLTSQESFLLKISPF